VGPPAGAGERNYFASVLEELRKVVWPTWNELGRMTGVVISTVILMALIVSAADFVLGQVVKQLYTSSSSSSSNTNTGSQVKPGATPSGVAVPATSAPATAPVTP
jgi:preprotein translocase SecE subunit